MTAAVLRITRYECERCGAAGPFTRQAQPLGLAGLCDPCWLLARNAAWRLYRAARRAGTLSPPERCLACGGGGRISGHHSDYRRPFAVRWLCVSCHRKAHRVTGRCAGCHKTGAPVPLRRHVVECPDWLALPPERQLGPEAEYQRWQEHDRDAERDHRREQSITATRAARAAVSTRFACSRDLDAELDALEEAR